jgi:hypothetical protein
MHFDMLVQKFEILTSATFSVSAAVNFNNNENTIMYAIGDKIIENKTKTDVIPTAFFSKTLDKITNSNPSFTKPPTIGTESDIVYLANLNEIPSWHALVMP